MHRTNQEPVGCAPRKGSIGPHTVIPSNFQTLIAIPVAQVAQVSLINTAKKPTWRL